MPAHAREQFCKAGGVSSIGAPSDQAPGPDRRDGSFAADPRAAGAPQPGRQVLTA